jgi:hypothetical protein
LSELRHESLSGLLRLEVIFRYPVDAGGPSALIAQHSFEGLSNPVLPTNQEVQVVEPEVRLRLSFLGETRLCYSDFVRHFLNSFRSSVEFLVDLAPFAMYVAFPRSDYYGASDYSYTIGPCIPAYP